MSFDPYSLLLDLDQNYTNAGNGTTHHWTELEIAGLSIGVVMLIFAIGCIICFCKRKCDIKLRKRKQSEQGSESGVDDNLIGQEDNLIGQEDNLILPHNQSGTEHGLFQLEDNHFGLDNEFEHWDNQSRAEHDSLYDDNGSDDDQENE